MLVVYPVSQDETHTAYDTPIGEYIEGQPGITVDQLKVLGDVNDVDTNIEAMTPIERYRWLVEDVGYYSFSALAIVDESKVESIKAIGDSIGGYDSSLPYEMFNKAVIALSDKVIPLYNKGIIEVDPTY